MIKKANEQAVDTVENMRGGEGTVKIQHFFKKDEMKANSRLCAKMIVPPGASVGMHQHDTEDEVYIIAKGKGLIDDGETQSEVNEGDAILTGNGDKHSIKNIGNEDLEVICFIMLY